jgi:hypothetical protein
MTKWFLALIALLVAYGAYDHYSSPPRPRDPDRHFNSLNRQVGTHGGNSIRR